jgi:hypothetical protein
MKAGRRRSPDEGPGRWFSDEVCTEKASQGSLRGEGSATEAPNTRGGESLVENRGHVRV